MFKNVLLVYCRDAQIVSQVLIHEHDYFGVMMMLSWSCIILAHCSRNVAPFVYIIQVYDLSNIKVATQKIDSVCFKPVVDRTKHLPHFKY